MLLRLGVVESLADGGEQATETLDVLLLGVVRVGEKLLDALVHDTLREHRKAVELSNEANESQSATLQIGRAHV